MQIKEILYNLISNCIKDNGRYPIKIILGSRILQEFEYQLLIKDNYYYYYYCDKKFNGIPIVEESKDENFIGVAI